MANDEQETAPIDPTNDGELDPQFDSHLEDEYGFDAHPMPGIETIGSMESRAQAFYPEYDPDQGAIELEEDQGSGSAAEDGRIEIGDHMDDSLGSAAMYGPSEIGGSAAENGVSEYEIGAAAAADRAGFELGGFAEHGGSEIGTQPFSPFESFMLEDVRLGAGAAADREGFELGAASAADRAGFELGSAAMYGPSEIGGSAAENGFAEIGDAYLEHQYEIGAGAAADREGFEIGALAVAKVVEKARDNRQPAPPMKAVHVDAPPSFDDEDVFSLTDIILGAADQFPLFGKLLLRAGAGMEPRIVRVDTEASYRAFRAENSPEFAALHDALEQHADAAEDGLDGDIEQLVALGAAVDASEDEKRVELVMPKRFDGLVHAWKEGNCICASIALPGRDGEVRICTSLELISKSVDEMARHATESGVNPSAVLGAIPEMGCILGAGTAIKEMAAGAASILARPEASYDAPFVVRIEPKTSPNLAALMMLCTAARNGVVQAQTEWKLLGQASPGPLKQAMLEALQLAKAAA